MKSVPVLHVLVVVRHSMPEFTGFVARSFANHFSFTMIGDGKPIPQLSPPGAIVFLTPNPIPERLRIEMYTVRMQAQNAHLPLFCVGEDEFDPQDHSSLSSEGIAMHAIPLGDEAQRMSALRTLGWIICGDPFAPDAPPDGAVLWH